MISHKVSDPGAGHLVGIRTGPVLYKRPHTRFPLVILTTLEREGLLPYIHK